MSFYRPTAKGVEIFIRLTPKSSRDAVEGTIETGDGRLHLKARVRAVPEDGKANAALEKLIADWLGRPRLSVSVTAGTTSRLKSIVVEGDSAELLALIEERTDQSAAR